MSTSFSAEGNNLEAQDHEQLLQTTRQLLAQVQALSSRIMAVNEIATAINRSLDLREILQIVAKKAKWLLDFQHLSIYLCGSHNEQFITLFGSSVSLNPIALMPNGPIGSALTSGEPQLLQQNADRLLTGYSSGIVIPLVSHHQALGTINVATAQSNAYNLDDVRIGYLLAQQLTAAIRNAERFAELNQLYAQLNAEKRKSDELLLNILPLQIANELKQFGQVKPIHYESASVLFTDFTDFTKIAEIVTLEELFEELNYCFSYFDQIVEKYNLEKLKTIGDSYMCIGGVPVPNHTHAIDTVLAAIEIQVFMHLRKAHKLKKNQPFWDLRIGIHSGPLLAGVVGQKRFAYDVWGDTVNTASRMESSGVPGRINVSESTFELIKNFFRLDYRGKVRAKNKGEVDMYLVTGIREHLAIDPRGILPNDNFIELYLAIHSESAIAPPFCQWISL
ncbi:MAG TPA: adenylate/guanylate cyclase domain-containing protein [Allocoleopsis sp.]